MRQIDHKHMTDLRNRTGYRRLRLRDWETVHVYEASDTEVKLIINTFQVKCLVREDRFEKKGWRMMLFRLQPNGKWDVELDVTSWDDEFEPYVYEKYGRRQTAEELEEQREWEKLCYRPGTASTPLDSYDRVLDPFFRSTKRMERHF